MKTKTALNKVSHCSKSYESHIADALLELHNVNVFLEEAMKNESTAILRLKEELKARQDQLVRIQNDIVANNEKIERLDLFL